MTKSETSWAEGVALVVPIRFFGAVAGDTENGIRPRRRSKFGGGVAARNTVNGIRPIATNTQDLAITPSLFVWSLILILILILMLILILDQKIKI